MYAHVQLVSLLISMHALTVLENKHINNTGDILTYLLLLATYCHLKKKKKKVFNSSGTNMYFMLEYFCYSPLCILKLIGY